MKRLTGISLGILTVGLLAWAGLAWLERSYEEPAYHEIEPGLYLGKQTSAPPPGTTAVVNLCGQRDRYTVANELWRPINDGGVAPSLEMLDEVVAFIREQRRAGRIVYVHCLAGVNRSGAATTAYLMDEHGWDRKTALEFVQSKRPGVRPDPMLMELLNEWRKP